MFTKYDKNLANYLVNNKIYNDLCSNNNTDTHNTNNNTNGNENIVPIKFDITNKNDSNVMKNLNDDDSVINSLQDMSDIDGFENITEKRNDFDNQSPSCKHLSELNANNLKYLSSSNKCPNQINVPLALSPESSLSSSSSSVLSSSTVSSSTSIIETNISPTNNLNDYNNEFLPTNNKKMFNRNIHCVKEKIRRDRIKFSCNELRRLIPNLNGVKTDMASLLETSVLWIQLINSNIPEQLLINVQNKLESLKLLRNNKSYLSNKNALTSPIKNLKIRNKNVNENIELDMKQENSPQQTATTTFNNSVNSSYLSTLESPVSVANTQSILPKRTLLEQQANHYSNNNMSKPSKWLSITQQKYSDLYSNRNLYLQDSVELPEQLCFMTGANNYSECDLYNKMVKKPVDYNNNNIFLGQVPYNDQLDNYCQNHAILIDQPDSSIAPSGATVYFQNQSQSALPNNCLF